MRPLSSAFDQVDWSARVRRLARWLDPVVASPAAPLETFAALDALGPSLMPRTSRLQGISMGLSVLAARATAGAAERLTSMAVPAEAPLRRQLATRVVIGGLGTALAVLPERDGERLWVASVRTAGRLLRAGAAGSGDQPIASTPHLRSSPRPAEARTASSGGSRRPRDPADRIGRAGMTDTSADDAPPPAARRSAARRRSAGIYGTIVASAVLAAGGAHLRTLQLAVTVVVTLLVYWAAEGYAELLGEHAHAGRLPSWSHVRASLAAIWPMVSASYAPLLALLVARVLGADTKTAATVALVVAIALLLVQGWVGGKASQLRGLPLLAVTLIAGAFGVVMILLKLLVTH
jgi:hypothetical protein